jgi:alpha-tubulin suppressor-like RCC1 family protein
LENKKYFLASSSERRKLKQHQTNKMNLSAHKKYLGLTFLFTLITTLQVAFGATPSGEVIYWGYDIDPKTAPYPSTGIVTIEGKVLTNAVGLAAGDAHAIALCSDGTVVGWGFNSVGQATGGEGTVFGWRPDPNGKGLGFESTYPSYGNGHVKTGSQVLSNVIAIAAAQNHSQALKTDGSIFTWGEDAFGAIVVPGNLTNVISIADGWDANWALKKDGTVIEYAKGNAQMIDGLSNIVAIAGSIGDRGNVTALKNDGVVFKGSMLFGNSTESIGVGDAIAVANGLALKKNGTVVSFGSERFLPTGLSNMIAIAVGRRHSLALKSDGTVITWGSNPRHALDVPVGLSNVVAIAAGDDFSLAITTNRAVADRFRH